MAPAGPEVKAIKIAQPKYYKGQDDIDAFDKWVNQTLHWLKIYKVTGPAHDMDRITKEGHYANECNQKNITLKDNKTGNTRLFAAEVIEDDHTNETPEAQEAKAPPHNEGDHEMLAEEEADANDEVIDIYGEYYNSDDDGEPIAYLGSMDVHDFDNDDEQICYA
ncbi:hypothetical protein PISMIDRAFT_17852 [Pisolithus microcarpus 441]|uniref:Uncharacterized protein n=1 Tax=Pisolithus microcarpus 441 TaxID=765257 RepID=A0A0C9Y9Q4_9AGAM|nr:hypothetical protein PISMIDRAFT_17852 [Pisolithus microcarpus 441]